MSETSLDFDWPESLSENDFAIGITRLSRTVAGSNSKKQRSRIRKRASLKPSGALAMNASPLEHNDCNSEEDIVSAIGE